MPGSTLTLNEAALNDELSRAFQQMRAINLSIVAERNRGNVAGVQALLPMYNTWLARYKAVAVQLGQKDFTTFDKFVLDTGTYVSKAVAALPNAAAALPSAIGQGLLKGALPFAALALLYLFIRGKL